MANPLDALNAEAVQTSTDSGLDEATKAATLDFSNAATAQINSGRGSKFSMPKYTGDVPVSESVLENMQRMLYEKEQGRGSLANTLQDVLAIFPGDPTLRSQSIGARNAQRLQEEADIFNLQQGISSGETAREQAKLSAKDLSAFTRGTSGTGGGAGGASPAMVAGVDPAVLQRVDQLASQGKYKAAEEMLKTALLDVNKARGTARLTKEFYMPDIQVPDPANPGKTKFVSAADINSGYQQPAPGGAPSGSGVNQFNVGNVRPKGASTGFQQPTSYAEGIKIMDDNLKAYGDKGINTLAGVISRWAPPNENDTPALIKAASQRLGLDPNQPIDLSDPKVRHVIGAVGLMIQEKGSKGIFNTAPAAGGKPSVGLTPEQKGSGQAIEAADKEFRENTLKPLAERVNTQRNDKLYADMAIDALKVGKYGPGSSIGQLTKEAAQALGVPLSPKEREQYFNNLTIEQVKQNFVASSARAAMGAQFTQVESERFAKTLAGITDPPEYIKTVYQIKKALAEIDDAHLQYMRSHKQNLNDAEANWSASGKAEEIMRRTVDKFRDIPTGGGSSAPASGGESKNQVVDFNTLIQQKNKKPGI
jgi:hypothetical protein